ncbi:transmembrane emp24-like trafficking protein 10, putative [Ichthyophthirius multifiliis]|uniref:Transmembrane emp24-like trafficking protein 10, putative n=1 Tax=Ichthyophthirius multifiliis TaxID=5932 RepID=G0QUG9_ICHMU|nr:transmembrane emp24-like trafficking protein 10, putative [Ichthyophthirius multifiliis]EGR31139.1 transmembrane emp24-like trafficking protein 10, putative [Ichthyophthirius multifiliis]|eukprot:XP_004034625.1 transmembrane emp24-like trafficking protein 10, putative [Ichthyophthirius multifiliis]
MSNETNGKVYFTTEQEGIYQFCIESTLSSGVKMLIDYKTGVEAKDYSMLKQKDDFQPIDLEVKKMEDMLKTIGKEKKMLGRKAGNISRFTDDVGFKVMAFSLITLLLLALLTIFQNIYLKTFFKQKKLI